MNKQTLNLIVGSTNPVKIQAAKDAFELMFPESKIVVTGIKSPSGVPDQPMNSKQTRDGAVNRVEYCRTRESADFYLAMEGGVDQFEDGPATFAYVVVASENSMSVGRSANLPLPQTVFDALLQGEELGHVMDRLFNTTNIKQAGGAIGLLTNGRATRGSIYTQAIMLAMAPLLHTELYKK
ncbi:inosine/xanthosine triphosphatase [Shewanella corallii]|uniref:Inosine/xanthosine triphosphatase n=1 Tax=Shewanella corallii TaxID=560080 RepID=A0ABT0N584_9GAMM|nr:inosine/xanthosine triphosphatase [Shewanella corallii]MCL2913589.1 inosine/xanthosine triphosphatase [Shewanella corallii]